MANNHTKNFEIYLEVRKVSKKFGQFTALDDISFQGKRGDFLCVLGPSGCGKTTILRIVAGLEKQTTGKVFIENSEVSDLPVSKRNVGIVFQSYALFPNLSASENVGYGLRSQGFNRQEIQQRVNELLELVGLMGMGGKYPAQLSGGQQQRVALARAMALSPDLLLLDEPLSALDAKVRVMLRSEIRQLQKRLGVTTIMVTHDQEEALTMADRILVMDQGRLVQNGTPFDIYDKPATPFVASFIGSMNFINDTTKESRGVYRRGNVSLEVESSENVPEGSRATVAIRPEDVIVLDNGQSGLNILPAEVRTLEYRGSLYRVTLSLPLGRKEDSWIEADIPTERMRRLRIQKDRQVNIQLPSDRLRVYPL
jgi:iron(III) transport system ATP-binding protein